MRSLTVGLVSAGIGAGLMFLLDPDGGRRRRSLIRDKSASLGNSTVRAFRRTAREGTESMIGGGQSQQGRQFALLQRKWPPAVRIVAGAAGAAATVAGITKGGVTGSVLSGIGASLTGIALTNCSLRNMIDQRKERHAQAS